MWMKFSMSCGLDDDRLHQLFLLGCSSPVAGEGTTTDAFAAASESMLESIELLRHIAGILVKDGRRSCSCSVGL